MNTTPLTADGFRALFPALRDTVWLDTAGSPPGCLPVLESLRATLDDWQHGTFDWLEWDRMPEHARSAFADYIGVQQHQVALVSSVTEASSIVAASIPAGNVVVADEEYRSMLWPFTRLDPTVNPVRRVPAVDGLTETDRLIEGIDEGTVLVAVSEVLSSNGSRVDLFRLKAACERVGARLYVDVTQTLGALDPQLDRLQADYVAVHGYKWMLAPRGAAWLVVTDERLDELRPTLAGWKSSDLPHGYFGDELRVPASARRADASPAWFSWIGAIAALDVLGRLDRIEVEQRVIDLSNRLVDGASALGYRAAPTEACSHIAVLHAPTGVDLSSFQSRGIRAGIAGRRFRSAVHYFVSDDDIALTLDALAHESAPRR